MTDDDDFDAAVPARAPAPVLTPAERQVLKGRAHALSPVVMIGTSGVTDAVIAETDRALARHGLIKVRVLGDDRDARASMLAAICAGAGAAPVQSIGKVLVIFRPLPPEAEAEPPARRAAEAPGRRSTEARPAAKKRPKPKPAVPRRVLGRAMPKPRKPRVAESGRPAVPGRAKAGRGR
jgi:RNA-binding protein